MKNLMDRGVKLRNFSDEIMSAGRKIAFEMYEDLASKNKTWEKVYRPWKRYLDSQIAWHSVNENVYNRFAMKDPDLSQMGVESADRKSTRLNSSHVAISYAVFCLKKKNKIREERQQLLK